MFAYLCLLLAPFQSRSQTTTQAASRITVEDPSRAATGSILGRITDLYSRPLEGVRVVLHNPRTGAEISAITARNGTYRLAGLAPGA